MVAAAIIWQSKNFFVIFIRYYIIYLQKREKRTKPVHLFFLLSYISSVYSIALFIISSSKHQPKGIYNIRDSSYNTYISTPSSK